MGMARSVNPHKHRWWLQGFGGLMLGALCQHWVSRNPPPPVDPAAITSPARAARVGRENATSAGQGRNATLLRDAASADAGKCAALAREIIESGDPTRAVELEVVFRRWMSLEKPLDVLAALEASTETTTPQRWSEAFFNAWAATDYREAMKSPTYDRFARERAVAAVENIDADFPKYLKVASFPDSEAGRLNFALRALGRDHPELARTLATADLPQRLKSIALVEIAGGWASLDPASALAWVQEMKMAPADANPLLDAVFGEWSKTDLVAARKALEATGLDLANVGRNDGPNLAILAAPTTSLTVTNPALARNPFLDVAGLYQSLEAAGIDWATYPQLPSAIDHDGWYTTDPAAAAKDAEKLPPGKIRDAIFQAVAENWAEHDLEKAREFAELHGIQIYTNPDASMRNAALADPQGTFAELLKPLDGDDKGRSSQLNTLALEWAGSDPKAASEWLVSSMEAREDPSAPFDPHLLFSNTLGYSWAKNDANEAIAWMDALPAGPAKSAAWKAMSFYVGESYSPDLAFGISAEVSEGETRMALLKQSLLRINQTVGGPAALAQLDSPDLTDDESAALRQVLQEANQDPPR